MDGDEQQREQHEHTHHQPPPEGGAATGGIPRRGALDRRAQDREACGPMSWHVRPGYTGHWPWLIAPAVAPVACAGYPVDRLELLEAPAGADRDAGKRR